jgi:hypothetical protein
MKKSTIATLAGLGAMGALIVVSIALADTGNLAVICSGNTSGSSVTWSAVATGGNAPYALAWSGDSNIAGATTTSVTDNFVANGTYTADVQVTDASSSVATSSCEATISVFPTPTPTPTPSVSPSPSPTPSPSATPTPVPTPSPVTSPLSRVNPPSLSIGANGQFLAHGMTVTSVASGSFEAEVWGITYTINWSGNFASPFEFWYRYNQATTTTPSTQLAVGDEVGVSGKVSSSTPMTVNANVVRDYSIIVARPTPITWKNPQGNGNGNGNKGSGNGNGYGNGSGQGVNASASVSAKGGFGNFFRGLLNFHFGK